MRRNSYKMFLILFVTVLILYACGGGGGGGSSSGTSGNNGTGGTQSTVSVSGFAVDGAITGTVRIDALYYDSSSGSYSSSTLGTVDLTNGVISGEVSKPTGDVIAYRACVSGTDGVNNFDFDFCQIITGKQLTFFINPLTNAVYAMAGKDVDTYIKDMQAIQSVTGIKMDGLSSLQDALQAVDDMKTYYNLTCTDCTYTDWADSIMSSSWSSMDSIKTQSPGNFSIASIDQEPSDIANIQLDTCNGYANSCTKYGSSIAFDIYGLMYVYYQPTGEYIIPLANTADISNFYSDVLMKSRKAVLSDELGCRLNASEVVNVTTVETLGCIPKSLTDVTCYTKNTVTVYQDTTNTALPDCTYDGFYDGQVVYVSYQARKK